MFKQLVKNKKIVYYVIILVLAYLIYQRWQDMEGMETFLAPAPASLRDRCMEQPEKSRKGCSQLIGDDGNIAIVMDRELPGGLIIHNPTRLSPVWVSNRLLRRDGVGPFRLVMQKDRNLVVYDKNNRATWASQTQLKRGEKYMGPYQAILLGDKLQIYDKRSTIVWSSENVPTNIAIEEPKRSKHGYDVLLSKNGGVLLPTKVGLLFSSVNQRGTKVLPAKRNDGVAPFRMVMQNDRRLVIYDKNNREIASTDSKLTAAEKYNGPYRAVLDVIKVGNPDNMSEDYMLNILDKNNTVVWGRNLKYGY